MKPRISTAPTATGRPSLEVIPKMTIIGRKTALPTRRNQTMNLSHRSKKLGAIHITRGAVSIAQVSPGIGCRSISSAICAAAQSGALARSSAEALYACLGAVARELNVPAGGTTQTDSAERSPSSFRTESGGCLTITTATGDRGFYRSKRHAPKIEISDGPAHLPRIHHDWLRGTVRRHAERHRALVIRNRCITAGARQPLKTLTFFGHHRLREKAALICEFPTFTLSDTDGGAQKPAARQGPKGAAPAPVMQVMS